MDTKNAAINSEDLFLNKAMNVTAIKGSVSLQEGAEHNRTTPLL